MGANGHRGRMFSRLLRADSAVSGRDILEMLLYFPVRIRDTRDIAVKLSDRFEGDLHRVLSAPPAELRKINGVGPAVADFLGIVGEITEKDMPCEEIAVCSIGAYDHIHDILSEIRNEAKGDELWAVFFDGNARIAGKAIIRPDFGIPGDDEIYLILQKAARCHGASVILAHVTGGLEIYPTERDTKLYKAFKNKFSMTNLEAAGYYMVGGDEVLKVCSLDSPFGKDIII